MPVRISSLNKGVSASSLPRRALIIEREIEREREVEAGWTPEHLPILCVHQGKGGGGGSHGARATSRELVASFVANPRYCQMP